MKHFEAVGVLMVLAVAVRYFVLLRYGVYVYVHDTYWVIPVRKIAF